jgi:hypothetical protein
MDSDKNLLFFYFTTGYAKRLDKTNQEHARNLLNHYIKYDEVAVAGDCFSLDDLHSAYRKLKLWEQSLKLSIDMVDGKSCKHSTPSSSRFKEYQLHQISAALYLKKMDNSKALLLLNNLRDDSGKDNSYAAIVRTRLALENNDMPVVEEFIESKLAPFLNTAVETFDSSLNITYGIHMLQDLQEILDIYTNRYPHNMTHLVGGKTISEWKQINKFLLLNSR